jgi:hypothetical protein
MPVFYSVERVETATRRAVVVVARVASGVVDRGHQKPSRGGDPTILIEPDPPAARK